LDIAISPTGIIYIAEYGANRIAYLAPAAVGGESTLSGIVARTSSERAASYGLLALLTAAVLTALALRRISSS
jgi:hypothetical protein